MYLLQNAKSQTTNFYTCGNPVDSEWFYLPWGLGVPLEGKVSVPVIYSLDKLLPIGDKVLTVSSQFLISPKMLAVVRELSRSFEVFASEILFNGQLVSGDHVTVNFMKSYPCMDWKRSDYEEDEDSPGIVWSLSRLVVESERVPPEEHLFRLGESPSDLLVTGYGRERLEAAGLTGISFEPVETS